MAQRPAEDISLIRELCQRLGMSVDSRQLKNERGLQSLMPLIQERMNQLRDEDTYGNVEEIPTDTCPVLYAGPLSDAFEPAVEAAVRSIMQSIVSTQAQLMLVAQALASSSASEAAAADHRRRPRQDQASTTVVQDTIGPLLADIRSELLFKDLLLTIVGVATGAVGSGRCSCSNSNGGSTSPRVSSSSNVHSPASRRSGRHGGGSSANSPGNSSPSSQQQSQRRGTSSRSSAAGSGSGGSGSGSGGSGSGGSGGSGSSFRGFPCYPSPRTATHSSETGTAPEAAAASDTEAAAADEFAQSRGGHGQATVRNRSGAPSSGAVSIGGSSRRERHSRLHCGGSRGSSAQKLGPRTDGAAPAATAESAWRSHGTGEELMSYSNMEARWRGRTMLQRRQEVYWPIEDAYLHPYEEVGAVARDQWQFTIDRPGHCPAYARLNRLQRADMMAHTLEGRRQRRAGHLQDLSGDALGPFELYNGVVHPLGPSGAPCRAAFVGD